MTPAAFTVTRYSLSLTQAHIAPLLGVTTAAVRDWEQGRRKISRTVELLLERVAADLAKPQNPPMMAKSEG